MMVKVASVWVRRAEGRTEECIEKIVPSLAAAGALLRAWSGTAPEKSCDKCDFVVTFEDGEVYEGRFELRRYGSCDIARHMIDYLTFYAGVRCPGHMTTEHYDRYIAEATTAERREACVKYLATYDLRSAA